MDGAYMKTEELHIKGMSCGHCVMAVRKELGKMPDVTVEEVTIGKARVQFDETRVNPADFARAIDEAGFILVQ
jgi:copper chaperone